MKQKLIYNILLLATSIVATVVSLILFISSFKFDDSWGKDLSFCTDYVILLVSSFSFVLLFVYRLMRGDQAKVLYFNLIMILNGTIFGFYPLGIFFKNLNKKIDFVNDGYVFTDARLYLALGIVGICFLLAMTAKYFRDKKLTGEGL